MLNRYSLSDNAYTVLLVLLLALAAAARFYALDQTALDAQELFYVSFCQSADGWFALMTQYADRTGQPPLYAWLLCGSIDGWGSSDFAVRSVSVLAGVGTVWAVAALGRAFFSPITGLCAAAVVAVSFQYIAVDRMVTPYSLFALLSVLHVMVLAQLLWGWARTPAPLVIAVEQTVLRLRMQWSPAYPGHAGMLLLFWLSAVLLFYSNPVALLLFVAELGLSAWLLDRDNRRVGLRWLWLPVLVAMLPWLPRLLGMWKWVVNGNWLGLPAGGSVLARLPLFFWQQKTVAYISLTLFVLSSLVLGALICSRRLQKTECALVAMIGLHLLLAGVSLLFVKAVDPRSFYYSAVLAALLLVWVVARLLESIRPDTVRVTALATVVVLIVAVQLQANMRHKMYQASSENGFDLAAKILAKDTDFMQSDREVLVSTELFRWYLDRYGTTRESVALIKKDKDFDFDPLAEGRTFYYLQHRATDVNFTWENPVYKKFSENYVVWCETKIPGFRVTKFARSPLPAGVVPTNCAESLVNKEGIL